MLPKTPQRSNAKAPRREYFHDEYASPFGRQSSRRPNMDPDSHNLSLNNNVTRDSMVEDMLSSFDKMPESQDLYEHEEQGIPGLPPANYNPISSQYAYDTIHQLRQDSHDSSYASDYSLHAELPDHYHAVAQGSRLGGGSGAQRQPSVEKAQIANIEPRDDRQDAENDSPTSERTRKGSTASNADASANHTSKSRWGRRSRNKSIDQAQDSKAPALSRTNGLNGSILDRARPVPVEYHDFDAPAPATIPGISRDVGVHAARSGPYSGYSQQPSLQIPLRSSSQANGQTSHLEKGNKTANLRGISNAREADVSGSLGNRSTSETQILRTGDSGRERQGFFKRVFGSSRNHVPTPDVPPQLPPLWLRPDEPGPVYALAPISTPSAAPKATANAVSNAESRAPIGPPPIPDDQGPVVKKKTSFFARSRKKTVGENAVPAQLDIPRAAVAAESLPIAQSINNLPKPPTSPSINEATSPEEQFFDSREEQPSSAKDDENVHSFGHFSNSAPNRGISSGKNTSRPRTNAASSRPDSQRTLSAATPQEVTSIMHRAQLQSGGDRGARGAEGPSSLAPLSPNLVSTTTASSEPKRPKTSPNSSTKPTTPLPLRDITNQSPTKKLDVKHIQPRTSSIQHLEKERTPYPHSPKNAKTQLGAVDDGWVRAAVTKTESTAADTSTAASRAWLLPTASEENFNVADPPPLPPEGAAGFRAAAASPTVDEFVSATSLPIARIGSTIVQSHTTGSTQLTPEDHEMAAKIFHGKDDYVNQAKGALVLGDSSSSSARVRKAYMDLFDFAGLNILAALRRLCGKLALKGETQQVDRILASFSQRWCDCNPNHGFKSKDVVHTICYSILLLNTDLHIADLDMKMTRPQFIKNTLPTIRRVATDEKGEGLMKANPLATKGSGPWRQARSPSPVSPALSPVPPETRESLEMKTPAFRLSVRPPKSELDRSSPIPGDTSDISDNLVDSPFDGTTKAWEFQLESLLKEIYNSIRQERLPLHGASEVQLHEQPSQNSLSVGNGFPRRAGSINSKAPSDSHSTRSRGPDLRSLGSRFVNKNRSRSRVYATSTVGSSHTSLDESSMWSPNASSTWSRSVFGKTQTTMSSDSLGSQFAHGDYGYQQSIGFANALSQSIIREDSANQFVMEDPANLVTPLLEDESLELAGAPWAKEGIVHHKHHLMTTEKKAKDRNWDECFAVVEKGYMKLFSFNSKASIRSQRKPHGKGSVVGGGNWMDNAENVGSFLLRQTIANALPPPGYSKTRPHVFALSLPTGAVHLFQVGTPEIAKEFVSTANYWSARLSKEPLVGGISNVEYGWSDAVINTALIRNDQRPGAQSSASNNYPQSISHSSRPSLQGSLRSSVDHVTVKARLPGDRILLSEWKPPQQSLMASMLKEGEQLEGLQKYVKDVEEELTNHNELRPPMLLAFTPSHPNARKAMSNWERKSSYLLREIVKFRTYIESLKAAQAAKRKLDTEKADAADPASTTKLAPALTASSDLTDEVHASLHRATTSKERLAEAAAAAVSAHG